ncbi:hypothetical protein OG896_14075 [Streptomyces sp. NBC_00669]|uniref:hypothetical protein n=1 Tax=unclassified Streptomyces TaxID=2593676 RepID=UPI002E37371C|nr:hypothetical protein [Streptomyces sp. NBC_00669]
MGQKQEDPGETPEQLKQRATDLRDCARTARKLAGSMGPYLDNAVGQAKAGIWHGPYATSTTSMLVARKTTLHRMASDLVADASRWETEAQALDDQAAAKKKQQSAKGGG